MGGTTTTLKLPYPTGTDRVMDGDNAMQALAERVEARMPWGCLGYAENASNIDVVNAQVLIQVTGVVVGAGRRILVQSFFPFWVGSVVTNVGSAINEDGVGLSSAYWNVHASGNGTLVDFRVITPTAGTHTYTLTATGAWHLNAQTTNPASLMIQDIGSVSLT